MPHNDLLQRAERAFVGGSNGEFRLPPEANLVVTHGDGAMIYVRLDGQVEYVDFPAWAPVP